MKCSSTEGMLGQGYPAQLLLTVVTWWGQLDVTAMLNCVVRCSLPRLLVCIGQQQSEQHAASQMQASA